VSEVSLQAGLFDSLPELPDGMRYAPELISPAEERALLQKLPALPFKEFEFHGFLGKRRTVSFGWHYDFNGGGLKEAGELPDFLLPLRQRAAEFGHLEPSALEHALLIEYKSGAGIGWHRDRPQFGDVIGISLLASCTFRLRRKINAKSVSVAAAIPERSQQDRGISQAPPFAPALRLRISPSQLVRRRHS
jgi:alkylated DNA repair dioxygenase AlkB